MAIRPCWAFSRHACIEQKTRTAIIQIVTASSSVVCTVYFLEKSVCEIFDTRVFLLKLSVGRGGTGRGRVGEILLIAVLLSVDCPVVFDISNLLIENFCSRDNPPGQCRPTIHPTVSYIHLIDWLNSHIIS